MAEFLRLHLPGPLAAGARLPASPGQAHYLASVMRRGTGDVVLVFNAAHGEWTARIAELKRDKAVFLVEARTRAPAAERDLWLLFSPLKRDATDMVVQKATELGVTALLPVLCDHTNTTRVNLERFEAIATEAAEQSERLSVPAIHPPSKLFDRLAAWPEGVTLAAAIENAGPAPIPTRAGALLIGPEGGFAPRELEVLARTAFIERVSLGPRVLRADTAAIAGLALLQAGDWSANGS